MMIRELGEEWALFSKPKYYLLDLLKFSMFIL